MTENFQRNVSTLLLKICGSDIESDDFYKTIERDYRKIEYCMKSKQEDLKIISELVNNHSNDKNLTGIGRRIMNRQTAIINAYDRIQCGVWNQLQEDMIPHHINNGKWLFENGRVQQAFNTWEKVLKHEPYNNQIHSKLKNVGNVNSSVKKKAEDLDLKYQLEYLGCFGNTVLKSPCSILAFERDKHLFVSDSDSNQVHKFDYSGKYLGVLPIELRSPMGLFRDNSRSNLFWICDFGNSRLLSVNFDGRLINEINLKNIVGRNDGIHHPAFGCVMHDQLHLILRDFDHGKRHFVALNKNNSDGYQNILTHSHSKLFGSIGIIKNKLYVCMINPGCLHASVLENEQDGLYEYNWGENKFKLLKGNYYSHLMRQFVQWNNNVFMSCGASLVKLSINGAQHFSINLSSFFGFTSSPTGLAVIERDNSSVLLIADTVNNSVHQFLIGQQQQTT